MVTVIHILNLSNYRSSALTCCIKNLEIIVNDLVCMFRWFFYDGVNSDSFKVLKSCDHNKLWCTATRENTGAKIENASCGVWFRYLCKACRGSTRCSGLDLNLVIFTAKGMTSMFSLRQISFKTSKEKSKSVKSYTGVQCVVLFTLFNFDSSFMWMGNPFWLKLQGLIWHRTL